MIITEEVVRRVGAAIPFLGDPCDRQPLQIGRPHRLPDAAIALVVGAVLITAFLLAVPLLQLGRRDAGPGREPGGGRIDGHPQLAQSPRAPGWWPGALAGVAVLFIATQDFSGAGLGRGTHAIALVAFPAAILGGLDSAAGAVVGGIVVGLTEALVGPVHLVRLLQERGLPRDAASCW